MKMISKLLVASALTAGLMNVYTTTVSAQSMSQSQDINATATCTTSGSYGQNTNCTVSTNGSQSQQMRQVLYRSNTLVHRPINTAVDPQVMIAGVLTMVGTSAGAILSLKKKVA
jgi:hypothetical protein